ncbi:MAG TPA: zinc-finger domain-containing protein [Guyparkeria sp.]|nr:zinc-finger domain-containing protein [Guyparkeria sp.]
MNPDTASHPQDFKTPNAENLIEVTQADLPVYCPREGEALWNSHPRVYIPLEQKGDQTRCIYCSAVYRLID